MAELWGGETRKAVENFPVSGERVPLPVVRWLGRIKAAAARVNAELGLLDADLAERIAAAADAVAAGEHDDQFPIDVFQTGSGTSSNMNANEVIANLAGDGAHANDHVNMGQSSNDVFPSAVHAAALQEIAEGLLPALDQLGDALAAKADEFADMVKAGRTHLMDAVPVTLGQEFARLRRPGPPGPRPGRRRRRRLGQMPLGGTAAGTGLNTHPEFAARVRERLAARHRPADPPPADPFEAQGARDAPGGGVRRAQGGRRLPHQDRQRHRLDGQRPARGLGEIFLPELQKGSSIMPGKVNPVIPEVVMQVAAQVIGNDTAITIGGMQGNFELNVRIPLLARNLLGSIQPAHHHVAPVRRQVRRGIEAEPRAAARSSPRATLAMATALNPIIGYDKAAAIVKEATASGAQLREVAREHGVEESVLEEALNLRVIAAGSSAEDDRLLIRTGFRPIEVTSSRRGAARRTRSCSHPDRGCSRGGGRPKNRVYQSMPASRSDTGHRRRGG